MRAKIGRTERLVTLHSKGFEVDVQDFMREHFPRKHNWEDPEAALEYLKSQLSGPYIQAMIDDAGTLRDKTWTDESENWVYEVLP